MTDVQYYRYNRLLPALRNLAKEYPVHTIENIIRQLEDRLQQHKDKSKRKTAKKQ